TLRVAAEHDEIAVLVGADSHARLVTALEVAVLVEPNFDRWVVTAHCVRRRAGEGRRGSEQRDHERENHNVLPLYTLNRANTSRSMPVPAYVRPPSGCHVNAPRHGACIPLTSRGDRACPGRDSASPPVGLPGVRHEEALPEARPAELADQSLRLGRDQKIRERPAARGI